jgi:hypothetical protein
MQTSRFVVIREDLNVDPIELVTDGLKIGRLPSCEVELNHPTVSRLHAGINEAEGRFYFFNFSHSSGTTLNGRVVEAEVPEVLADGDVIQIGPFFLHLDRRGDALYIRVGLQVAASVVDVDVRGEPPPEKADEEADLDVSQALNVFWEKRKRESGKMQRLSPLRPHAPSRVVGKVRFNWTPTRDLVRPWPFSVFIWALLIVGALSVAAAYAYTNAFSPAPISDAHARTSFRAQPAIAREPNAASCTSCHSLTGRMDSNCSSCHTTPAFTSSVTKEHADAGIGCTACHVEHMGTEFRPVVASLETCNSCHNDANNKTYNGKKVGTPHGGTVGYPLIDGKWAWKGLTPEEWEAKPASMREKLVPMEAAAQRWPVAGAGTERRRSAEFHVLHVYRAKAVAGLVGDKAGLLTCSSCHKTFGMQIDRTTPRTTCAICHNGDPGGKFETLLGNDKANCDSCHVQHVKGPRTWGSRFLLDRPAGSAMPIEE